MSRGKRDRSTVIPARAPAYIVPMVRARGAVIGERQTRSARVNGLVGRRVVVVVVEMGSDIYLCSVSKNWVHRAEAKELGLCFKTQKDCMMRSGAWKEGTALGCVVQQGKEWEMKMGKTFCQNTFRIGRIRSCP